MDGSNLNGSVSETHRPDGEDMPEVSVIVPIYGAESTLQQALDSVRAVNSVPIEIICIDDCSADGCAGILENIAETDSRLVILKHSKNMGYGASMNDGLAAARGKWVSILEPDDYILPDAFCNAADIAVKAHPCVDIVKTPYIREIREEGIPRGGVAKEYLSCSYKGRVKPVGEPFSTKSESGAIHLLRHHPSIWSALYRREFLERCHIGFKEYPGGGWADNEFFYKTMLSADSIVYSDEPFYVYREETPQEVLLFRRKNPGLPFERWHAMQDILDGASGITPEIRSAHTATGFTYLCAMQPPYEEADATTKALVDAMFDRMDADTVRKEAGIRPYAKNMFFNHIGAKANASKLDYISFLLQETVYSLKENGLAATFKKAAGI